MKRSSNLAFLLTTLLGAVEMFGYGSTPPPTRHSGGFGESVCTACHTGTSLNAGGGRVLLANPPATYTSGQRITLTVRIEDPAAARWGFQLTARSMDGRQAGYLEAGSGTTVNLDGGMLYLSHAGGNSATQAGRTSPVTFTATWVAPDISAGVVAFDIAANAANNNNANTGDHIYQARATINAGVAGETPSVYFGGVVNSASFARAPQNRTSPGGLVSIFGRNLANMTIEATRLPLSSTMGGAVVTFNGVAAPLLYVSPGQINAIVPELFGVFDSVQVQVTVSSAAVSSPEIVPFAPVSPGVFTVARDGQGLAAALHADGRPVTEANPARRGEFVQIYCAGLGSTSPPAPPGLPAPNQEPLARTDAPVRVSLGGVTGIVPQFAGLAPGFASLYQVNIQVPSGAPSGRAALVIFVGGVPSQVGVILPVQ
jgi:uncharacterized protein (TIGR03437 family)